MCLRPNPIKDYEKDLAEYLMMNMIYFRPSGKETNNATLVGGSIIIQTFDNALTSFDDHLELGLKYC